MEVWTGRGLVTYYLLYVISLADRAVSIAGITTDLTNLGCFRLPATPSQGGMIRLFAILDRTGMNRSALLVAIPRGAVTCNFPEVAAAGIEEFKVVAVLAETGVNVPLIRSTLLSGIGSKFVPSPKSRSRSWQSSVQSSRSSARLNPAPR